MYDPAHPGESLRDAMDRGGMDRDRDGREVGLYAANVLAASERPHRHIAGYGAGVGTHRLEQRRFLGAAAGALRTGTRAFAPGEIGRMTRCGDAVTERETLLDAAFAQLRQYALALENPPIVKMRNS